MKSSIWMSAALAAGALALCAPAHAQHVAKDPDDAAQSDKARGKLRAPTKDEVEALVASMGRSLSQSDAGLVQRPLPNGAVALDLEGRFESIAMARIGADGKVVQECVTSDPEARHFLTRDIAAHERAKKAARQQSGAKASPEGTRATTTSPALEEK
jgi:hypothetical protein